MNIWDSVHRGLEKASHEASRIARTQRLRSTIDGLTRQINTQQGSVLTRIMELFSTGRLTQNELIPLCQELANLQQQLAQAQHELKQLQAQTPAPAAQNVPATPPSDPYPVGGEIAPTVYAPPPPGYPAYIDSTVPSPIPPPPPGVDPLTVSAMETVAMPIDAPPPPPGADPYSASAMGTVAMPAESPTPPNTGKRYCQQCHAEVIPGNVYCHNCGSPVQNFESSYLPTTRGSAFDALIPQTGPGVTGAEPTPADSQETVRADAPQPGNQPSAEKEGGH
ncbi:MAG TPA: zinc ribbon domain-containing protein [Ktedonosporobacter sp.]|nr:zinc ribbon domain-containing protein [Ktedonosporobacter sp.]